MKKLGEYQNDIVELEQLEILNYERIFKLYLAENNNKQFYFYNILNKIVMPDNISSDLISYYRVHSKMPLTTISYNIYGDIKSWWIIYLLNKEVIPDLFWVNGGTQLKYLNETGRTLIYNEITRQIIYNGRHY